MSERIFGWTVEQFACALVYWKAWHTEDPEQNLEGLLDLQEFWEAGWTVAPTGFVLRLTEGATERMWANVAVAEAKKSCGTMARWF